MIDIETERLVLRLVPMAGLAATAAHDAAACRKLIAADLHPDWFDNAWVADLRLSQWKDDPAYAPWSIRAIALRATGEVVGNINCHDKPEPFSHEGRDGLVVELGYTVFPPWRRQGIAREAIGGLTRFVRSQGVRWIRLSVSPSNAPSQALAKKLGAIRIGTQDDELDGPEDVLLVEI